MCLGALRGEHSLKVARSARAVQRLPQSTRLAPVLCAFLVLTKFFDVIAQNVHPIVGPRVGLGDAGHLATHTEGFSYALPLGPWQSDPVAQLLGIP